MTSTSLVTENAAHFIGLFKNKQPRNALLYKPFQESIPRPVSPEGNVMPTNLVAVCLSRDGHALYRYAIFQDRDSTRFAKIEGRMIPLDNLNFYEESAVPRDAIREVRAVM